MESGGDMDTNHDHHQATTTTSSSVGANSRWNPTKEQISMLENLYRQGIRTPNADQIQQITSRLRAFGHIEGKNVFYWFQNHKARQRQKQKQESLAYFHRFLHATTTTTNKVTTAASHDHLLYRPHQPHPFRFSPPNVACNPYYLPQTELGFYHQQYPKAVLPMGGFMRMPISEKINDVYGYDEPPNLPDQDMNSNNSTTNHKISSDQETLPLFPLHPTGILQGREGPTCSSSSTEETITINYEQASPAKNYGLGYTDHHHPFINFFSGQGSCGSD